MKTFKNNFVARRLWAFALVFAIAIGMFGNTTAFAAEASTNGVINHVVCHGSSQDYTSNDYEEYTFEVKNGGMYYVSYVYENYNGNISAGELRIYNSKNERVAGCPLYVNSSGKTDYFTLQVGNYKARVYPSAKPYMYSFNIYWKQYTY